MRRPARVLGRGGGTAFTGRRCLRIRLAPPAGSAGKGVGLPPPPGPLLIVLYPAAVTLLAVDRVHPAPRDEAPGGLAAPATHLPAEHLLHPPGGVGVQGHGSPSAPAGIHVGPAKARWPAPALPGCAAPFPTKLLRGGWP